MSKREKEFLREFIMLYKSFPCLWKVKCKEYSDRNAKNQAYEMLIQKLQTVDPEANRVSVVRKINSLRTTYRKELKKVINSERFAVREEDIYVPHLWYYELLNFIRDQTIPWSTKLVIEDTQVPGIPSEPESMDASLPSTPFSSVSQTSSESSRAFKRCNENCDEVLDVVGRRLKSSSTFVVDKFTNIGKAWASKLRDLSPQQAIHAEKIINDVFYEAEMGNLNRSCVLQIQQVLAIKTQSPENAGPL